MSRQSPFSRFDLFKLVVAVLLVLLALWLALGAPQPAASQAALPQPTALADSLPSSTPLPASDTPVPVSEATPTRRPATLSKATATTSAAGAAPTVAPELSPTSGQAAAGAQAEINCPLAMPTRLKEKDRVRVQSTLNIRSAPEISGNLLQINQPGTELEITGGPVCVPFESGAHLWWEVRRPDGITGWSAEGAANGSAYFMEPVD